jgi:hypothetical protein
MKFPRRLALDGGGSMGNAYRILVWKYQGKLPLWTTVRRRKDNIKINLTEIAFEYID